jgi:hypothetical protein
MQGARIFRNEVYLPVRRSDLKMKRNAADGLFTKPSNVSGDRCELRAQDIVIPL